MSLSCECGDNGAEPGQVIFYGPADYSTFPAGRRRRCCSCRSLIAPGDVCLCFERLKIPETEIELRIWGEEGEIPLTPWWHCEECADLYWSLTELGFCFNIDDSMRELAREYAQDYGPPPPLAAGEGAAPVKGGGTVPAKLRATQ